MKKYFMLKSLTWWAGAASIVLGVYLIVFGQFYTTFGRTLSEVLVTFTGADPSPAGFIIAGLLAIGLRRAQNDR